MFCWIISFSDPHMDEIVTTTSCTENTLCWTLLCSKLKSSFFFFQIAIYNFSFLENNAFEKLMTFLLHRSHERRSNMPTGGICPKISLYSKLPQQLLLHLFNQGPNWQHFTWRGLFGLKETVFCLEILMVQKCWKSAIKIHINRCLIINSSGTSGFFTQFKTWLAVFYLMRTAHKVKDTFLASSLCLFGNAKKCRCSWHISVFKFLFFQLHPHHFNTEILHRRYLFSTD